MNLKRPPAAATALIRGLNVDGLGQHESGGKRNGEMRGGVGVKCGGGWGGED